MQKNVLEYLENTVKKFPNKIAIIDEKSSISFEDLQHHAKCVAATLQSKSINRNLPVGVFLPKSIEAVKSFLGVLYNGDFYVPLDVKNPFSRIEAIIKNIDIKYIITDSKSVKLLNALDDSIQLIIFDEIDFTQNIELNFINYKSSIDMDPVYILNTSGSTGVPKGVTLPHKAMVDYIDWVVREYKFDDNLILGNQSPLHFDISASDLYVTLATGSTLVLIPESLFMFPPKLLDYLEEKKVNFIYWVPSILTTISKLDLLKNRNLSIKTVFYGGESMPTKHLMYWKNNLESTIYSNFFGPTETTVICTHYILDRDFADDEPLPIGYACKNTDVLVLDDEDNLISEINEIGELCVRGSSLALGYYNDPEKTALVFVQNPLNKAYPEKIYRTGDIVYYNKKGELIYKGRKDFQIKHMGYRIELGEIETAILAIDGVDNACVLYDNENNNIVLIYESAKKLEQKAILLTLHNKLPKYMLPTKFILLDGMPLNINGKIDRNKLKELI
ncbi:AMP-forming adenylation domain superfamily protein, putative D-alanine:D-alanyl carrier protein ligase [Aliarcobacter faecis]|uniref:amino acid adenylation domain-containing protein n=1 Tax=Aliarcobacter faecis TaxID=1564138 RepID=UPI0004793A1A|nr:amino acid adenylation domain-containing protein [Aliarcobacter faecis]QKF73473.1 AMP-forming adenylation domain superfamily protein, putative D-alanine:D-alanyl carrier protein ligase [Aliarcobacter faecis]